MELQEFVESFYKYNSADLFSFTSLDSFDDLNKEQLMLKNTRNHLICGLFLKLNKLSSFLLYFLLHLPLPISVYENGNLGGF